MHQPEAVFPPVRKSRARQPRNPLALWLKPCGDICWTRGRTAIGCPATTRTRIAHAERRWPAWNLHGSAALATRGTAPRSSQTAVSPPAAPAAAQRGQAQELLPRSHTSHTEPSKHQGQSCRGQNNVPRTTSCPCNATMLRQASPPLPATSLQSHPPICMALQKKL